MQKLPYFLLAGGCALCALSAIIGWIIVPNWINSRLNEEGNLRKLVPSVSTIANEGGDGLENIEVLLETWKEWSGEEPVLEMYKKVYLFNVSNPEETKKGMKPILNEVGPFVYRQIRSKSNIVGNEENHTIFYNDKTLYFFEPEMSSGTEDDSVTVINIPFVGLAREIGKLSPLIRYMVTSYIDKFNEDVFVTKTVREMLFGGYYQGMVASFSQLTFTEYLPNNTFGFYYGRNGSDMGRYEIDSGIIDSSNFGQVLSWNGKTEFNEWKTDKCKSLTGTDDFTFPPRLKTDSVLKIFKYDMCRIFPLEFSEESEFNGVTSYRFVMTEKVFQDPRQNKDNMCFCTLHLGEHDECPSDGAVQISACRHDAPVYISMPHFLFGPEYIKQSEGFHPDPEKHQTYVEIEPNTGMVLRASSRFQANLELMPLPFLTRLQKVPHVLVPFMWEEDTVTITPAAEAKLYRLIGTPTLGAKVGSSIGIGIGALLILIALIIFLLRARKGNDKYAN